MSIPLEEIAIYVNSVISLVVLAFLVNVIRVIKIQSKEREQTVKENAESMKEILNARLEKIKEEKVLNEERLTKENQQLQEERDKARKELDLTLSKGNISVNTFSLEESAKKLGSDLSLKIKELTNQLEKSEVKDEGNDPEYHISMANGFMSNDEWGKAADHYEQALKNGSSDWRLYSSQGVAYANTRTENLLALQSYSNAIVFLPIEAESNIKSRLFIYRGAMLKRLRRIEEAILDVEYGRKLASKQYEILDSLYNLCCLYAMSHDQKMYSKTGKELKSLSNKQFEFMKLRLDEFAPEFKKTEAYRSL